MELYKPPIYHVISAYKIDNVWMGIESDDDGTLLELHDYFSFLVPGYRYKKQFRDGYWDGRIKLFSPYEKKLYRGLLPYLKIFARQYGYNFEISPNLYVKEQLSPKEVSAFVDTLYINKDGKEIKPRFYQKIGLYHMINARRKVLVSPTASGKSLMIYMFSKWYFDNHKGKIGLVVPTTNLVEQMTSDFEEYSQGMFNQHVHKIYSGKQKNDPNKQIYITTWQSVYELPKNYFDQFGTIMIDECHGAQAASLKGLLEKCQAEYRIGLTGTMHEPEAHKWTIEGLLGDTVDLVTLDELQKRKMVAQLKINCISFDYTNEDKKEVRGAEYHDEIKWLINHERRTNKIIKAVGSVKENSFVLFDKVAYGKKLYEDIKEKYPNRRVYLVFGATKVLERETIRKALEFENGSIVVASYRVFSTGTSVNNLHHLFFAEPVGKSIFRVMQSIGRTLRLHKDKEYATLWDFFDQLTTSVTKLNHTMKHAVKRIKMYNKEKLPYTITKVHLGDPI